MYFVSQTCLLIIAIASIRYTLSAPCPCTCPVSCPDKAAFIHGIVLRSQQACEGVPNPKFILPVMGVEDGSKGECCGKEAISQVGLFPVDKGTISLVPFKTFHEHFVVPSYVKYWLMNTLPGCPHICKGGK